MKNLVFIVLIAALCTGCGQGTDTGKSVETDESASPESSIRLRVTQTMEPMLNIWTTEYTKSNPGITFTFVTSLSKYAVSDVLAGQADLAITARPLTEQESSAGAWAAPVALDALVPVISFDNPGIQPLVMYGMNIKTLKEVFSGKDYTWGRLTGRDISDKVKVFVQSDSSDNAALWNTFLGLKAGEVSGRRMFSDASLLDSVARSRNSIGYSSIMHVYHLKTGLRRDGIYVLPVDFNDNGIVDDNEHLYDNFSQVSEAIRTGKLPFPPSREYHVVTGSKPPEGPVLDFVVWLLTIGQNYMPDAGYLNISKASATASLRSLQ